MAKKTPKTKKTPVENVSEQNILEQAPEENAPVAEVSPSQPQPRQPLSRTDVILTSASVSALTSTVVSAVSAGISAKVSHEIAERTALEVMEKGLQPLKDFLKNCQDKIPQAVQATAPTAAYSFTLTDSVKAVAPTPIPTPLPDFFANTCTNIMTTAGETIQDSYVINSIKANCDAVAEIARKAVIDQADLTTIQETCASIASNFKDEANTAVSAQCQEILKQAAAKFAASFCKGNIPCTTILQTTIEHAPAALDSVIAAIKSINGIAPTSINNLAKIRSTCLAIADSFSDETAKNSVTTACESFFQTATAQYAPTFSAAGTNFLSVAARESIADLLNAVAKAAPENLKTAAKSLSTIRSTQPISADNLVVIKDACQKVTDLLPADASVFATKACADVLKESSNQFITHVCQGGMSEVFSVSCSNIISTTLIHAPEMITDVASSLMEIKEIDPFSVSALNTIKAGCDNLVAKLGHHVSFECSAIMNDALHDFGQSICKGASSTFTDACSGILSNAIFDVTAENQSKVVTSLEFIRAIIASKKVLEIADVNKIQTSCQAIVDLARPAVQESLRAACNTITIEAAKKVGYGEWLHNLATQHIAQNIAHGIGHAIVFTTKGVSDLTGWIGQHAHYLKDAIPATGEGLKNAATDNPWSTTGIAAVALLGTGTTAYLGFKHRSSIASGVSKTASAVGSTVSYTTYPVRHPLEAASRAKHAVTNPRETYHWYRGKTAPENQAPALEGQDGQPVQSGQPQDRVEQQDAPKGTQRQKEHGTREKHDRVAKHPSDQVRQDSRTGRRIRNS